MYSKCKFSKESEFHCWIFFFQVLQARANYSNGHTGQLSTLSVFLMCAGSLGLAFASLLVCNEEVNIIMNRKLKKSATYF